MVIWSHADFVEERALSISLKRNRGAFGPPRGQTAHEVNQMFMLFCDEKKCVRPTAIMVLFQETPAATGMQFHHI